MADLRVPIRSGSGRDVCKVKRGLERNTQAGVGGNGQGCQQLCQPQAGARNRGLRHMRILTITLGGTLRLS